MIIAFIKDLVLYTDEQSVQQTIVNSFTFANSTTFGLCLKC